MKKLLLVLFLFPVSGYAQQYTRAQIQHKADSFMKAYLGERFFAYTRCKLNTDAYSYYRYTDSKGKLQYAEVPINKNKWTKGEFEDIKVWYKLKYPYPKCAICDTVRGKTFLLLDSDLEMVAYPDIGFIPDYVWANDSCRFTPLH
jgi:hypothetical protein